MAIVKLGDIIEVVSGLKPNKNLSLYLTSDFNDGISWVKQSDVDDGLLSRTKTFFKKEFINLTRITDGNETYFFPDCNLKVFKSEIIFAFDPHTWMLKPKNNLIMKKFIWIILIKNLDKLWNNKHGTTIPFITKNDFNNFKIFLPDLEIQNKIISIIEPFEKLKNKIFIKSNKLFEIIRNIPKGVKTGIFKNFFTKVKHKQIISKNKNIIDLSIINSKSLLIDKYNDFDNFFTNKFFAKKNSILISSIRPNLQKQIIVFEDTNYLGTLLNYEIINPRFQFIIPYLLLSNNFIKYQIKNSKGTKMPVVNSNDIEKYIFSFPEEKYWNLLSITFEYLIVQNKLNILLNKIIKNLIKVII